MKNKIGLEEHFATDDTLSDGAAAVPADHWPELKDSLLDFHGNRLRLMDKHGIEMMVLSLNTSRLTKKSRLRFTYRRTTRPIISAPFALPSGKGSTMTARRFTVR